MKDLNQVVCRLSLDVRTTVCPDGGSGGRVAVGNGQQELTRNHTPSHSHSHRPTHASSRPCRQLRRIPWLVRPRSHWAVSASLLLFVSLLAFKTLETLNKTSRFTLPCSRTGVAPPLKVRKTSNGIECFSDYFGSPEKDPSGSPAKTSSKRSHDDQPSKAVKPIPQRVRNDRPDKYHEIGERGR
jgi:hypothetical protein